jgi:hypothetical protein
MMKTIKVIIVFILIILTLNSARAAEFSILPWPDTNMDFVAAINLVKATAPSKFMLSLWGWERLEPKESNTKALSKELEGAKYAMSLGLDKGQYFGITVIDTVKRVQKQKKRSKKFSPIPRSVLQSHLKHYTKAATVLSLQNA